MKFYNLDSAHIVSEYVNMNNELYDIANDCCGSEIQLISKEPITVELKKRIRKNMARFYV